MQSMLHDTNLKQIQRLIEGNYAGRDELYAAAASMDDSSRESVCRKLADFLAANAIELQQLVVRGGDKPAEPLDVGAIAQAMFDLAKTHRGESGVLKTAEQGEIALKEDYDAAIDSASTPEARETLLRQREKVDFAEQVLHNMRCPAPDRDHRDD